MNKRELKEQISAICGVDKESVLAVINTLEDVITDATEEGETVYLKGFGKFFAKEFKEKKGRNPATGESIILPQRKKLYFKASRK